MNQFIGLCIIFKFIGLCYGYNGYKEVVFMMIAACQASRRHSRTLLMGYDMSFRAGHSERATNALFMSFF